ncbi:hypothetical protein TNCV_1264561 [Trichonephila clavipes]|nr:hypothetical protein TNCV_1264561 [Trichonephila clavipes]
MTITISQELVNPTDLNFGRQLPFAEDYRVVQWSKEVSYHGKHRHEFHPSTTKDSSRVGSECTLNLPRAEMFSVAVVW